MAVSLPPVSAKFIADVEGMLVDLKRAERATKSTGSVIDREVDQLTKSMKRKFSASDIGKDLLKGLGIGSGFAAAQQAAEIISGYWREAAEAAQAVAASTDRQLAATLQLIRLRQNDDQALAAMLKEQARLQKELAAVQAPKFYDQLVAAGRSGSGEQRWKSIQKQRELNDEERKAAQDLATQLQELAVKIEQARAKVAGNETKAEQQRSSQVDRLNKQFAAFAKDTEQGMREQISLGNEQLQQMDEAAEKYRRMVDPAREARQEIEKISELIAKGALDPTEGSAAKAKVWEKYFEPLNNLSESVFEKTEQRASEFAREMAQMWNNVSDRAGEAFADIVLTGEASFSKLADIVARSVLEIVARMAIINPLLNMLFGDFSGWSALPAFFGGGKAAGGAVEPGYTYRVNENGQEFFKPSVGGTIMPVGASKGMKTQASVTYAPSYTFARGVDRAELIPILREHGRMIVAAISDAQRRGAPLGSALV